MITERGGKGWDEKKRKRNQSEGIENFQWGISKRGSHQTPLNWTTAGSVHNVRILFIMLLPSKDLLKEEKGELLGYRVQALRRRPFTGLWSQNWGWAVTGACVCWGKARGSEEECYPSASLSGSTGLPYYPLSWYQDYHYEFGNF